MELRQDLKGRDFIAIPDFTADEIGYLLDLADFLKQELKAGRRIDYLSGKTLGMIFQKNSTRTRVSFEAGIYYLGGVGLFLSANDLQMGRGEPLKDTARTLSRFLSAIMIRTFAHDDVLQLAQYADIPVINGLTDFLHPCQVMADLQTIREHKGGLKGLKMTYLGDGNNMAHSLINGGTLMGMDVAVATPSGYEPDKGIVAAGRELAAQSGGSLTVTNDVDKAVKDADIVYTDVWASMGQEAQAKDKYPAFAGFQINAELMAKAKSDAIVMHCLPAKRGLEITDDVIEGKQSVVFDEAENRLHAQMAVMAAIIK